MRAVMVPLVAGALIGATPAQAGTIFDVFAGQGQAVTRPSGPTEAQKRRAVAPYVRALTDCYAASVQNDSRMLWAYQNGSFTSLVASYGDVCAGPFQALVGAFDRSYGLGQASLFLQGPYAVDLERALRKRITPRAEAMLADQRAEQARRAELTASAKQTSDAALKVAVDCGIDKAAQLIPSNETADAIAGAAISLCYKEVEAAARSSAIAGDLSAGREPGTTNAYTVEASIAASLRPVISAGVMQARATAASAPAPSTEPAQARTVSTAAAPAPAAQDLDALSKMALHVTIEDPVGRGLLTTLADCVSAAEKTGAGASTCSYMVDALSGYLQRKTGVTPEVGRALAQGSIRAWADAAQTAPATKPGTPPAMQPGFREASAPD